MLKLSLGVASAALFVAGCAVTGGPGPHAVANLAPTAGNPTSGVVHFTDVGSGRLRVAGEVRGLKPGVEHGFHVHEKGDCSSPDAMSAGGHFNPTNAPHGRHTGSGGQHAGDLPSLRANASGVAAFSFETSAIALGSSPTSVVGKGLVVHRDPDDYTTQPTGNSGPRLACAVIQRG